MTDQEPKLTPLGIFQQAAAKHTDTTGNDALIISTALEELHRAEDDGLLVASFPTAQELKDEWIVKQWQGHARSTGTRIKNKFLAGGGLQEALDFGVDYESVVTICNAETLNQFFGRKEYIHGRKVVLGALTSVDLLLMREQLRIAKAKNDAQWERLDPMYRATAAVLKGFIDYRAYSTGPDEATA